jgi:hypothetical protein
MNIQCPKTMTSPASPSATTQALGHIPKQEFIALKAFQKGTALKDVLCHVAAKALALKQIQLSQCPKVSSQGSKGILPKVAPPDGQCRKRCCGSEDLSQVAIAQSRLW